MRLYAAALLALYIAAPSTQNSSTQYFRYERPIIGIPQASLETCVPLRADLFAHAAPQLADLRLYRGSAETPYVIREAAPVPIAAQSILPLNSGVQGRDTVFDAAMPGGNYSDVELEIEAENFLANVIVTGSRTQGDTRGTKLGSFTIFDLSGQKLGRSTVLHLPPSDFRYLHLRVTGPVAPDKITGLSTLRLPTREPTYQIVARSAQFQEENRRTVVEFTVPARVPVDRILFTAGPEPQSFSREVTVSIQPTTPPRNTDDMEPPQPRTFSGTLIRLHTIADGQKIDEEHLAVDTSSATDLASAKWTVTVENGDDAPLPLSSVQLDMLQRNLCFEADGRSRYSLFYGDPALQAPRYDYAALHTSSADATQAATGQEKVIAGYQPRPDERPFTDRHPMLLWAALVGVILLLGTIALKSNRQVPGSPG